MAAVATATTAVARSSDERPLTALPLFGAGFALYGFADGRLVGADSTSGAVRLKDPELPCLEQIFSTSSRHLGAVPRFEALPEPTSTAATFAAEHLETFVPAVIPGLARNWPALGRWDLDFFASACGSVDVQVTLPDGKRRSQRMADYLAEVREPATASSGGADRRPYLRGWYYERDCPWLAADLWKPGDFHDDVFKDWFKRLPKRHHPDFHWLFLGGAGAATPLHVDPTGTHAWLTQLSGRKRFVLFAPCDLPALLRAEGDVGRGALLPLEEALARKVPCMEVVLEPGDTLFVPAFWAHHVECIDESVSVTWNFLGKQFFPVVRAAFLAHQLGTVSAALPAEAGDGAAEGDGVAAVRAGGAAGGSPGAGSAPGALA